MVRTCGFDAEAICHVAVTVMWLLQSCGCYSHVAVTVMWLLQSCGCYSHVAVTGNLPLDMCVEHLDQNLLLYHIVT